MARKKLEARIRSYGIYTPFEKAGREIPRILTITTEIPARLGIEFGYVLDIRGGRGEEIHFEIDHPSLTDDSGEVMAPFTGEEHVRSSRFSFFLGDTIWAPAENKVGPWTLTVTWNGTVLARKTLHIVPSA